MSNYSKYFNSDGSTKRGVLSDNRWLKYLCVTDNVYVNTERVDSMDAISGKETLKYVLRTLDILDELIDDSDEKKLKMKFIISEVLKWSEVAKGGIVSERKEWIAKGYPLSIHNISSAMIFFDDIKREDSVEKILLKDVFGEKSSRYAELIKLLIRTHGLVGQCIRGESRVEDNSKLSRLSEYEEFDPYELLMILNECIIRAVSEDIWNNVSKECGLLIDRIIHGDFSEYPALYRLEKLCPGEINIFDEDAYFFANEVFPFYELWYFTSALTDFDIHQVRSIMENVVRLVKEKNEPVKYINFKPLSDNLYYDYEGKKHVNVYKKRIIEKYIKDASVQNVELQIEIRNLTAFVDFKFSRVCEKLIDFCVEAERSGLLTFEKSIIVLYDMFGFRRDSFDRLNNEDKYLDTMNNVTTSTKDAIIEYVTGRSVVDVGSGGGILLDRLEKKYPDKEIIGTDISTNVIETLNLKKSREGHSWNVRVHNFVENTFDEKVGSIIFSSILHEIYSYTEGEEGCFDIKSVKTALKNAYESLDEGGRIVIRDGIKTEGNYKRRIVFKDGSGLDFFKNYVSDFKGLKDLSEEEKVSEIDEANLSVCGDVNFIREFMYTYTWGSESYAHEVREQFGYFTLKEYTAFFEEIGAKVIAAKEFLEPGYPANLNNYLTLLDEDGNETEYPFSNCIIVVEKQ